jgi:hypothetical protein
VWKDNIKMDLEEVGWVCGLDYREWQAVLNTNEPSGSIKCREFLD